ncbi:MAG: hypothetical protein SGI92_01305 [Bryobacteraceae bacterium]|nr:hypothetical protein [Bryobacteraceae bacterium]
MFYLTKTRPAPPDDPKLEASLQSVTTRFRRIVILMDGAESVPDAGLARSRAAGLADPKSWAPEELEPLARNGMPTSALSETANPPDSILSGYDDTITDELEAATRRQAARTNETFGEDFPGNPSH